MGETRLIEITKDIARADGVLSVAVYVTSLSESDIRLLFNYLKSSKYKDVNYLNGLICFSRDYLKSKGYSMEEVLEVNNKKK